MISAWARLLTQRPWTGWVLWGLVSALVLLGLSRLEFREDLKDSFRPQNEATILAEQRLSAYPISETAFTILVTGQEFFTAAALRALEDFDFELRGIQGIDRVVSIFDARSSRALDGYHPPLMPAPSDGPEVLREAALEARANRSVNGVFLSNRGDALLFFAAPEGADSGLARLGQIERAIRAAAGQLERATGFEAVVSGVPVIRQKVVGAIMREQVLYAAGGAVLGALMGWWLFRSWAAVVLVFLVPQVSSSWILGAMGLAGQPVNVMNSMVIVLVMVLALANAMHLILAICRQGASGLSPKAAVQAAAEEVGPACFLTSLTTAIAFASLVFSSNRMVVAFGLVCAAGTLLVFGAVMLLIPLFAAIPAFGRSLARSPAALPHAATGYLRLAELVLRFRMPIFAAGVVVTAAAVVLGLQVRPDFSYRENVDRSSPEWASIEAIDQRFAGSQPLYFVVDWGDDAHAADLEKLLRAIHDALPESSLHAAPRSIVTLADVFGDPVAELLGALPAEQRGALVREEDQTALVTVPTRDAGASALLPFLAETRHKFDRILEAFPGYSIEPAGLLALSAIMSDTIIRELAMSLGIAAVLIFGVLIVALRSPILGLLSILPNILPIAATLGLLAALGEPLRYNSALALTICLGVAVDDTVHLLFRYNRARRDGSDPAAAVRHALPATGAALVNSTLILTVGLGMLLLSSLPTIRLFGVICILTLVVALVADLLLLPAMLRLFDRRQIR